MVYRKILSHNTFRPDSAETSARLLTGLFQLRVLVGEVAALVNRWSLPTPTVASCSLTPVADSVSCSRRSGQPYACTSVPTIPSDGVERTLTAINECLPAVYDLSECRHFEVETYAWGVLPAELQQPDLAAGIAEEMRWLAEQLNPLAIGVSAWSFLPSPLGCLLRLPAGMMLAE
jgi:hypothetical protein